MVVMRINTVIVNVIYCHYWPEILGRDGQWMEETRAPRLPSDYPRTVCVDGGREGETRNRLSAGWAGSVSTLEKASMENTVWYQTFLPRN